MPIIGFVKKPSNRRKTSKATQTTKLKEWQPLLAASLGSATAILTASIAFFAVQQTIASQTNTMKEQIQAQSALAYGIENKKTSDQLAQIRVALCTELTSIRREAEHIDSFAASSYAKRATAAIVVYKPRSQIYESLADKLYLLSPKEIGTVFRAYEFQDEAAKSAREVFASADGETFTIGRDHLQFAQIKFFPLGKAATAAIRAIHTHLPPENQDQCRDEASKL
ncbi:hypothetical protein EGT07_07480 [Herbaspirillum sp. HC18]|nr:hypothetical protein EGT07_07480 [Herbaspirillum sp. HC18]